MKTVTQKFVTTLLALATLAVCSPPTRAQPIIVESGSALPAPATLINGDILSLLGDPAPLTDMYILAGTSITIQSSDPLAYRTITTTAANRRLFDMLDGVTQTFDRIIFDGGSTTGNNDGAAIRITGSTGITTLNGDFIVRNGISGRRGGGISVNASSLIIGGNIVVEFNTAGERGGGLYVNAGTETTFQGNAVFTSNTAGFSGTAGYGGAIGIQTNNRLTFEQSSTFTGNTTLFGHGGAIYSNGNATFEGHVYFENNSATASGAGGGGMYVNTNRVLQIERGVTAINNRAAGNGGALYTRGNFLIAGSSTFTGNQAGADGGAIYMYVADAATVSGTLDATLGDITFTGNTHRANTTAAPNAILIRTSATAGTNPILTLNTGAGANAHTIYFHDPMQTSSATSLATINQSGDGTVVFDTSNSNVAATTTINSGTFKLTRGAAYGVANDIGSFTLAAPATLSGNGAIRANTITLNSGNTLEVLGGGALVLDHTAALVGGSGLTLAGSGTIIANGALTASRISIGTLTPDAPVLPTTPPANTAQTLAFDATTPLTLASGGTVLFDLFGGTSSDQLIAESFAITDTANINLTGVSGTYTIITANTASFDATAFSILVNGVTPTARYAATPTVNNINSGLGRELVIDFSQKNIVTAWSGAADGIWKHAASTNANWTDNGAVPETYFQNGDSVRFTDAATNKTVTIDTAGVTVADMTVSNAADTYTFAGAGGITSSLTATIASSTFTPTGKLTKTGLGTLNFANTAANNFAAGIEISGGVIGFTAANQLGDGGNGIHFTEHATLRANADNLTLANALIVDAAKIATIDTVANTLTYTGDLSAVAATGTLAKIGAGTLKLTGNHATYAASTLVREGTLSLDTATTVLGGRIDILGGAILSGIGSATGSVTIAPSGIIRIGATHTAAETLTLGDLTLDSSIVRFDLFAGNTSDQLTLTGALTATGTNIIDISAFTSGSYNLGNIAGLDGALVYINGLAQPAGARQTAVTSTNNGNLLLIASADMSRALYWTGSTSATWTPADANWTDQASVTLFANGDRVILDSTTDTTNPGNRSITIEGTGVTVSDIQIQGDADYTFAGAGITADAASVVTGTLTGAQGKLTKTGSGTLAFTNAANTFRGGIELSGGALTFTHENQLGDGGNGIRFTGDATLAPTFDALTLANNITIDAGMTATLNTGPRTLTLSGTNTGAGGLIKTGAGNLIYTAASALGYTGGTQIDDGYVMLRNITGADATALAHTITLNGGWLDLSDIAMTDTTNQWTNLNIVQGANASAGGVIGMNDVITVHAGTNAYAIGSGTRTGVYVVINAGDGTAILTGSNAYKGYTRIDSGTLQVTTDAQLGDTTAPRELILNGGALQIGGTGFATTRTIELRAAGAVTTDAGVSTTWDSITGAYAFTKAGTGTLTIANASAATALNVTGGRYVALTSDGMAAGSGLVTVASGATAEYQVTGPAAASANNYTGAGTLAITGGTLTLSSMTSDIARIAVTNQASLTFANAASAYAFSPAGVLTIDNSTVNIGAPDLTLGNITMSNNATLAFIPAVGSFKQARLAGLNGGGTIVMNADLGFGFADKITIASAPHGDFQLLLVNTGSFNTFTTALALIEAPASADATFSGTVVSLGGVHDYTINTNTSGGNLVVEVVGSGALNQAGQIINATAGTLPLSWFSELTTVSQRLGELRLDTTSTGQVGGSTWVRGYGRGLEYNSKATGAPFSERQIGADAGIDYKIRGTNLGVHLGGFVGYGEIERTFDNGLVGSPAGMPSSVSSAEGGTESAYGGLYATLITKTGWYVDGILKANSFLNDFTTSALTGETMSAKYRTVAFGGSIEAGKYIALGKGWFVEPQVQAAYVEIEGKDYSTTSGINVEVRSGATTQTRAGVMFGRTFETAYGEMLQVYIKGYVASQWTTGGELIADGERFTPTIKGDSVEGGGGVAWLPTKRTQLYLDFETAKASYYTKPWGVNFGFRYGW